MKKMQQQLFNIDFDTFITTQLNAAQQQAVTTSQGSVLVVAGAGSGKTRVITARIAYLMIAQQVAPASIVALTFTNKAALEMKERIALFLGGSTALPFVGTFHSYCLLLLKQYAMATHLGNFSILDEEDQHKIIKDILVRANIQKQISPRQVAVQISQIKNIHGLEKQPTHHFFSHPLLHEVYMAYEKEKKLSKCYDFDDLLLEALALFTHNPSFKERFHQRVRHVLIDEYQDTNVVQHQLLLEMAKLKNDRAIDSVCAVGDEDQSIYSWRGATVANMIKFTTDFPNTTIITIEQNYRSVQPILKTANAVIQCNTQRNPKNLWSERKAHDRVRLLVCNSEYHEADLIARSIIIAAAQYNKNSMTILYRTHAQSRALEEALIKHSIPYKIIGNIQFYERKEIKDIIAYLKLLVNPFDKPSLLRIMNVPSRGLGDKFEEIFKHEWNTQPFLTGTEVMQHILHKKLVVGTKAQSLSDFIALLSTLTLEMKPSTIVEHILKHTAYYTHIITSYDKQEAEMRLENIKELIYAIKHFESNRGTSLAQFLEEVSLMQETVITTEHEQDKVSIMTLHAAKGLEFDLVFIIGLEEGLLPSSRSLNNDDAIEEERRLLYVGITRAKERLLLTRTHYRSLYGQATTQMPSRFVHDLPFDIVTQYNGTGWGPLEQTEFFNQWLGLSHTVKTFVKPSTRPTHTTVVPHASKNSNKTPKLHHPVQHEKYGVGTIVAVDTTSEGQTCLTIRFKTGVKKIIDTFVRYL